MSVEPTCDYCGKSDKFRCKTFDKAQSCADFKPEPVDTLIARAIDRYGMPGGVTAPAPTKTTSDGGSTSYYRLPEGATELQDCIEFKNMNFAVANIFKACYRLGEKSGTDADYDLNKIIFFAKREKARRARNG